MTPEFVQACEELGAELETRAIEAVVMAANNPEADAKWKAQAVVAIICLAELAPQTRPARFAAMDTIIRSFCLGWDREIAAAMKRAKERPHA